jgi:glycerol-3-phosphate dehydrogenase subunit B
MLGVHASDKIHDCMEQALKVKIFEIPTSPVSVPGIRLKETLLKALDNTSVTQLSNQRITKVLAASDLGFEFEAGTADTLSEIRAKSVILAGGRFLGRGLCADREKITEPLFGLPVVQPATRDLWHAHSYFDPGGHPINQAGIETDALFRPVNQHSEPVFKSLFVAGSILAHQDWIRTRCGSGLAVGTGFQALQACLQIIGGEAAAL